MDISSHRIRFDWEMQERGEIERESKKQRRKQVRDGGLNVIFHAFYNPMKTFTYLAHRY
jgi:hypothetical protein